MNDNKIFITGANGQLGTALRKKYPQARHADINELDITNRDSVAKFDWSSIDVIVNAAAFTNVDEAETLEGRITAWSVNAIALSFLSEAATNHGITLVHISSDYVFDGSQKIHTENEIFSPLSVYGASKAAGDLLAATTPQHYILRTSWVIGEGKNFVKTMLDLAQKNISPTVVSDQIGRLTFTSELVRAIDHLLSNNCAYGTYNVTNSGDSMSWADITRRIFQIIDRNDLKVTDITTDIYYEGKQGIAQRPLLSTLDLTKIHSTGFESRDWNDDLLEYIRKETS
ncbi:NAD(P)-dependent oxidoreductase [Candidatus Nomurabacteria bacterium]|nr:NAD(P)-dependent oxidoreductase [Candidatus Nomurabacteria bacterium]